VDVEGEIMEVVTTEWKPVISFEYKGDTILYAADFLSSGNTNTYRRINKAGKENNFLHYIYGKDYKTFNNVIREVE
jgi:hypothetical protein